jgi:hypothetical protein
VEEIQNVRQRLKFYVISQEIFELVCANSIQLGQDILALGSQKFSRRSSLSVGTSMWTSQVLKNSTRNIITIPPLSKNLHYLIIICIINLWDVMGFAVFSSSPPKDAYVVLVGTFCVLPGLVVCPETEALVVVVSFLGPCFKTPTSIKSSTRFRITSNTRRVQTVLSRSAVA